MDQNFPQIFVFGQNYRIVEFGQNLQICRFWWIIYNLSKNLDFSQNCWKFLILVKIDQNVDFGIKKYRYRSKLSEILDFAQNLPKMSILDKIAFKCWLSSNFTNNVDLGQNLQISRFWWNFSKNFAFGEFLWKSRFWSKLMENSILDKIAENVDCCKNFRKMSIWVKISWFWSKSSKNFHFNHCLWKSRFWSKFTKISVLVKIVGKSWSWSTFAENLDFSQDLR